MTASVKQFPGSIEHCRHVEAAARSSSVGRDFGDVRPTDNVVVLLRGFAQPERDLHRAREEGSVPDEFVADLISRFLREGEHRLVTLEDAIHRSDHPAVQHRDRPCWSLEHGVVWPIFSGETAGDAHKSLGVLRGGPLLYGFHRLTDCWRAPADGSALAATDLAALRKSLVGVMVDVYDWDGYVWWTRAD
jgi:hypothetical protein